MDQDEQSGMEKMMFSISMMNLVICYPVMGLSIAIESGWVSEKPHHSFTCHNQDALKCFDQTPLSHS